MAAPATPRLYSWDEIKDWPESTVRTELVDGELVISPTPSIRHQEAIGNLIVTLDDFVGPRDLGYLVHGPLDVVLAPAVVYQPDVLFISKQRKASVLKDRIYGPPDLIVEVISEHNRSHDTSVKFRHYEQYGVK